MEGICVCGWVCRYCVMDVITIKMALMKIHKYLITFMYMFSSLPRAVLTSTHNLCF